jgi:DivIVA domain-containing protein
MALTPEDVINKRFQPTKFREGYDQDEVDDFLDEIVVELRRLNQENADLKQQLEAAGQPVAPRESTPSPLSEPELPAEETVVAEPVAGEEPAAGEPAPVAAAPEQTVPASRPQGTGTGVSEPVTGAAQSAAGVLAMAQKLHDDYVAEGTAERDRLIAEGRSQAEELVDDARRTREQTLTALEAERAELENGVSGLRAFEQEYRTNLKDFISDQLRELEAAPSLEPAADPDADGAGTRTRVPSTDERA